MRSLMARCTHRTRLTILLTFPGKLRPLYDSKGSAQLGDRLSDMSDPPAAADLPRDKVRAEEIRLWLGSPAPMTGSLLAAVVGCWALWDSLSHALLAGWVGATFIVVAIRIIAWRRFAMQRRGDAETIAWGRWFLVLLGAASMLTAVLGATIFLPADIESQIFIAMAVAGLTGGATAAYGAYLPAVITYVTPPMLAV